MKLEAGLWGAAQRPAPPPSCWPSPAAEWTESGDRRTYLEQFHESDPKDTDEDFEVNATLALARGSRGLRTGPLPGFAAHLLSGLNFLFDAMWSRMFVTRGGPDEAEGFPEP